MEEKVSVNKNAALANAKSYDNLQAGKYIDSTPHVKHKALRKLYRKLVIEIYNTACATVSRPKVLDLGAGEGSATLFFLELGAEVTAVDISKKQLEILKEQTSSYRESLSVCHGDVNSVVEDIYAGGIKYDIIVAIPIVARTFQLRQRYGIFFCIGAVVIVSASLAVLLCNLLIPELDILCMVNERFSLLFDTSSTTLSSGGPTSGRSDAIKVEMTHWLNGTLVLGRGLNYFKNMQGDLLNIAFGHVGYVTYLSQLGLIGFYVYAFFLPLSVIRNCKHVWLNRQIPVVRYAVFLSASSMIYNSIMFTMSGCFLSLGSFIPAVLAGMAWSLARTRRNGLDNNKDFSTISRTKI